MTPIKPTNCTNTFALLPALAQVGSRTQLGWKPHVCSTLEPRLPDKKSKWMQLKSEFEHTRSFQPSCVRLPTRTSAGGKVGVFMPSDLIGVVQSSSDSDLRLGNRCEFQSYDLKWSKIDEDWDGVAANFRYEGFPYSVRWRFALRLRKWLIFHASAVTSV